MIATNIRRLSVYLVLAFASVAGALGWWQVLDAQRLATRPDNPQVIAAHRSLPRGSIFDARGQLLASSVVLDGVSTRTYADPAFSHVIGYASLRFGTTAVEAAWDDLLTGRTDPNPLRDLLNDILARQPDPHDLTLTIDRRLQDFAAAQLGSNVGAVVAIDPRTGAILAIVSSPSYDATGFSGNPDTAQAAFDAVLGRDGNPLLDRTRRGHYVPGSIMKVLTAAAALDAGAITPETTFPDQPQQEVDGFVVSGFTIREHDLGSITPELWPLSPALQVSSNIFFAHVGLEIEANRYLDYARRFGLCAGLRIGSGERGLAVDASHVSARTDAGCAPFVDDVELASAAFGQGRVSVTPLQMALLAATIANDGVVPHPFVVRDLRTHAASPLDGPTATVLETYGADGGNRAISSQAAAQVRSAMIDAVEGPIGRRFAGAGAVTRYGVSGTQTAGKTGTAERGPGLAPHSWFIGFAPAQDGSAPTIAIAVIVEGGGSGSGHAAPIGGAVMAEWLKLTGGA
ncbi:MAG: penicillin-binding transpeptidase domain-containing protein [Chloroflexota bacterium]|nr:penicillin-binding transpeptidase domain-containing protein [Chloroflexota bacterium]